MLLESKETLVVSNGVTEYVTQNTEETRLVNKDNVSFISLQSVETVLLESNTTEIVLAGQIGPPGSSSEDSMPYAVQIDTVGDTIVYKGEAIVGSLTSSPVWRIRKVITDAGDDMSVIWADGNADFDNVWDDRLTIPYT